MLESRYHDPHLPWPCVCEACVLRRAMAEAGLETERLGMDVRLVALIEKRNGMARRRALASWRRCLWCAVATAIAIGSLVLVAVWILGAL
jgi:hypothetical protein